MTGRSSSVIDRNLSATNITLMIWKATSAGSAYGGTLPHGWRNLEVRMGRVRWPDWPPEVPGPGWPPGPPDAFAEFRRPTRRAKRPPQRWKSPRRLRLPASPRRRAAIIVALHVAALAAGFTLSIWLALRR